jgi:hypothetical protein
MIMADIRKAENEKDLKLLRRRFALGAPADEIKHIFEVIWPSEETTSVSKVYAKARVLWADAVIEALGEGK